MEVAAILPAAGLGTRMGKYSPESAETSRKQFMLLEDSPILIHTIRKFVAASSVSEILVAGEPELRTQAKREKEGIPVHDDTWAAIVETGKRYKLDLATPGS